MFQLLQWILCSCLDHYAVTSWLQKHYCEKSMSLNLENFFHYLCTKSEGYRRYVRLLKYSHILAIVFLPRLTRGNSFAAGILLININIPTSKGVILLTVDFRTVPIPRLCCATTASRLNDKSYNLKTSVPQTWLLLLPFQRWFISISMMW